MGSVIRNQKDIRNACARFVILVMAMAITVVAQTSDSMVKCWAFREPVSMAGGLLVDSTNVYAVTAEDRVLALDRKSGEVAWTSEPGGNITMPIRPFNSSLIVVSRTVSSDGKPRASYVRSISKATGITNWVTSLPPAAFYNIGGDDKAIYILAENGPLTAVDLISGTIRWTRDGAAFAGKDVHLGSNWIARRSSERSIEVMSLEDRKILGRFEVEIYPKVIGSRTDGTLVVGDARGNLESVSLGGQSNNWSYKAGGAISDLILRVDNVVAASADNFVYSISLSSGNVEWKRRMPGRINSIGTLAESKLAMTVVGEKTGYILDLADGRFAGRVALEGDEEFLGYPLVGDERFVAALTNRGVTAFSAGCPAQKAAVKAAA